MRSFVLLGLISSCLACSADAPKQSATQDEKATQAVEAAPPKTKPSYGFELCSAALPKPQFDMERATEERAKVQAELDALPKDGPQTVPDELGKRFCSVNREVGLNFLRSAVDMYALMDEKPEIREPLSNLLDATDQTTRLLDSMCGRGLEADKLDARAEARFILVVIAVARGDDPGAYEALEELILYQPEHPYTKAAATCVAPEVVQRAEALRRPEGFNALTWMPEPTGSELCDSVNQRQVCTLRSVKIRDLDILSFSKDPLFAPKGIEEGKYTDADCEKLIAESEASWRLSGC